jgi:peptide/nickel transport system permease protein
MMLREKIIAAGTANGAARKPKSLWSDAWRRLKKNRAAMLGLVVLAALIFCAVFADVIAPAGYDDQVLSRRFHPQPCIPLRHRSSGTGYIQSDYPRKSNLA